MILSESSPTGESVHIRIRFNDIQEFKKIPVVCDMCLQYMCGSPEDVFQKLVLPSIVSSRIDLGWSGLRSKHLLIELSQQQSFKSFNVFFNFFMMYLSGY